MAHLTELCGEVVPAPMRLDRETRSSRRGLAILASHPLEIDAFIQDVLIPVTNFFRDNDSFEQLNRVLREKLQLCLEADLNSNWRRGAETRMQD